MDSAADGLLALSNTAAALADGAEHLHDDDDRSSSLSELDDAPENIDLDVESTTAGPQLELDSEAETERLEESPDKFKKKPFGISPSKLMQSITVDDRPEIEALTDSGASSPISPLEDSEPGDSDEGDDEQRESTSLLDHAISNKRKRLSDVLDAEDEGRIRRRRTGSLESDIEKDNVDSEIEDVQSRGSREVTIEPLTDGVSRPPSERGDEDEDDQAQARVRKQIGSNEDDKSKKTRMPSRSITRRKGNIQSELADGDEENEPEESDEEVDADDADAQAKSAEEQAKRVAAMEALSALEQRFATLRDRLYDERIAQINHELAQLAKPEPTHPELLRQLECVRKYRDDKYDIEQKLLVYKIAALKRKSIAERSTIHSAYFQTIRDIREKHLERISEQFYRIQRDRFKSNAPTPVYTVPFPTKRSQQITQQMSYNLEVSILSGVAKYVGFPAAPELPASSTKEQENDLEKMGITINPVRSKAPRVGSTFDNMLSEKAAGQQFIEQTPWANPQHPMNRLNANRQASNKSPFNESYLTPAQQQRTVDNIQPAGSASTIPEHPSQPASSALNTPHDAQTSQTKVEPQTNGVLSSYGVTSVSPTETRRAMSSVFGQNSTRPASQPRDLVGHQPSSPLTARAHLLGSPKRTTSVQPERMSRNDRDSPFRSIGNTGVTAGNGMNGRVGLR